MKRGETVPPAGRRGPFSFKNYLFNVFGLRSGPDGSAQTVGFIWFLFRAKRGTIFNDLGPDRNFGQPGLDLTGTFDTSSEAALDVTIRNHTQN